MPEIMVRKIELKKNKTKPMIELADQIMNTYGIRIKGIERNGDDFTLIFDRNLKKEDQTKVNTILNLIKQRFPEHDLIEVEE